MRLGGPILCVSDVHLVAPDTEVFTCFARQLRARAPTVAAIFLLGDIAHAWIGDDDDAPLARALEGLLLELSRHTTVAFLPGNHDFLLGTEFAARCELLLLDDPTLVEVGTRRVLLAHGDRYCTLDTDYQEWRTVFTSDEFQTQLLARPLAERRELAKDLSRRSVDATSTKSAETMDVVAADIVGAMGDHDVNLIVHGHTHRPGLHNHPSSPYASSDDPPPRRIVLGAWHHTAWLATVGTDPREDKLECVGFS